MWLEKSLTLLLAHERLSTRDNLSSHGRGTLFAVTLNCYDVSFALLF